MRFETAPIIATRRAFERDLCRTTADFVSFRLCRTGRVAPSRAAGLPAYGGFRFRPTNLFRSAAAAVSAALALSENSARSGLMNLEWRPALARSGPDVLDHVCHLPQPLGAVFYDVEQSYLGGTGAGCPLGALVVGLRSTRSVRLPGAREHSNRQRADGGGGLCPKRGPVICSA